ncbi:four helix bundle protein [Capnocytophaga catalasegens]|uniref:Four helix bundle protein n=1 Tax=Capnocytophaga catalasegens TaxID=1004260 RepID=A0AAV5AUS0_9FLAO|nr:four helix bundle protein [Capnocytophaga catalasegens]GIZ14263.1 four helix bundle protein [Capnocytophaga catalasegens]GJM49606.1 four helix bundle protein [Capnocytophaga catalasegens]GJM52911.1 four helix bundle protein [Capnocytophaga catalasegens]
MKVLESKETLALTKKVFELLNHQYLKNEFEFSNQMKRAVLSISNNIAEGSEYNNNAQFVRFLKYAKGSCAEVRNMLNICGEIYNINTESLKEHCKEISVQLSKFIDYLKVNDNKRIK